MSNLTIDDWNWIYLLPGDNDETNVSSNFSSRLQCMSRDQYHIALILSSIILVLTLSMSMLLIAIINRKSSKIAMEPFLIALSLTDMLQGIFVLPTLVTFAAIRADNIESTSLICFIAGFCFATLQGCATATFFAMAIDGYMMTTSRVYRQSFPYEVKSSLAIILWFGVITVQIIGLSADAGYYEYDCEIGTCVFRLKNSHGFYTICIIFATVLLFSTIFLIATTLLGGRKLYKLRLQLHIHQTSNISLIQLPTCADLKGFTMDDLNVVTFDNPAYNVDDDSLIKHPNAIPCNYDEQDTSSQFLFDSSSTTGLVLQTPTLRTLSNEKQRHEGVFDTFTPNIPSDGLHRTKERQDNSNDSFGIVSSATFVTEKVPSDDVRANIPKNNIISSIRGEMNTLGHTEVQNGLACRVSQTRDTSFQTSFSDENIRNQNGKPTFGLFPDKRSTFETDIRIRHIPNDNTDALKDSCDGICDSPKNRHTASSFETPRQVDVSGSPRNDFKGISRMGRKRKRCKNGKSKVGDIPDPNAGTAFCFQRQKGVIASDISYNDSCASFPSVNERAPITNIQEQDQVVIKNLDILTLCSGGSTSSSTCTSPRAPDDGSGEPSISSAHIVHRPIDNVVVESETRSELGKDIDSIYAEDNESVINVDDDVPTIYLPSSVGRRKMSMVERLRQVRERRSKDILTLEQKAKDYKLFMRSLSHVRCCFASLASFLACWGPFYLAFLIEVVLQMKARSLIKFAFFWFGLGYGLLNIVIHAGFNRAINRNLKILLRQWFSNN